MDNATSVQTLGLDAAPSSATDAGTDDCLAIEQNRHLTLQDFLELVQRIRCKLYRAARGKVSVGNQLTVIDADIHESHATNDVNVAVSGP